MALITGGTGDISFAIAKAFIEAGYKVIICGINENKLHTKVDKIKQGAPGLVLYILDVDSLPTKIEQAVAMFSENKIDILVNSAGVTAHSSFLNMAEGR